MNYRWNYIGEHYVLSQKEHEYILDCLKKGMKQVVLRNGTLGLNLVAGYSFSETNEKTDDQVAQSVGLLPIPERPLLPTADIREPGFRPISHDAFYKKMGWEHPDECVCKTKNKN